MKLRPFELLLVSVFGILAVVAIALLALYKPNTATPGGLTSSIEIWGTLPKEPMEIVLNELVKTNESFDQVSYRYVPPEQFETEFVTALADRTAPDLLLIPHDFLVSQRNRILPLSYENFSQRTFRSRFIDGAEIFTLRDGVYALPVAIDPLLLFWNRDQLTNAGFVRPPRGWVELTNTMVPKLVQRDFDRTVTRAAIALGEYDNVAHALPIISMLSLQAGSQLVTETENNYQIKLNQAVNGPQPLTTALEFYMRFSNPQNQLYTWNRSLATDRDMFTREDLSFYFGFGSEATEIARYNPNLSFDVSEVPQSDDGGMRRTYGKFYGLALVRNSDNLQGAALIQSILAEDTLAARLAEAYHMAPASRYGLERGTSDIYGAVSYASAPIARAWLTPAPAATGRVFADMVRTAAVDRGDISSAVNTGLSKLQLEY